MGIIMGKQKQSKQHLWLRRIFRIMLPSAYFIKERDSQIQEGRHSQREENRKKVKNRFRNPISVWKDIIGLQTDFPEFCLIFKFNLGGISVI